MVVSYSTSLLPSRNVMIPTFYNLLVFLIHRLLWKKTLSWDSYHSADTFYKAKTTIFGEEQPISGLLIGKWFADHL